MLVIKKRDVKLKTRKFRNKGEATGTLKRTNGEIIPISTISKDLDKYLDSSNDCPDVTLDFEGEIINAKIKETKRHLTIHNTINVDFLEV